MGQVKTTFVADINPISRSMRAVEADILRYQREREKFERDLTRVTDREVKNRERAQLTSLRALERETRRVFQEEERLQRERSARFASLRSSGAAAFVTGAAGAGYLAQQAIQKTIEQERATRLLAAAATEAGLAQGILAQKNKEFAASVGLSNQAAAETTAQIARLATNAGQTQNLDKLLKSFANLGAARGIAGADLNNLIGTILSGQDEGLNRLGIADPGQLYKQYAESVGKTTEELTQMEKVQAAVNAVMDKAAIFAGAAEARMNSLEGQVAKSTSAWENFTNALSATFTTSGPVTDFLNEASRALGSLSLDLEEVNRQLAEGKTPRQIAEGRRPSPTAGDYISSFAVGGYGIPGLLGSTGLFGEGYRRAISPEFQRQRRVNEDEARIANQQTTNQQQALAAQEQALTNYYKKATDQFNAYSATISKGVADDVERQERAWKKKQELLEKEKKLREDVAKATAQLFDSTLSGQGNQYLDFLVRSNREMQNMLELAKNLSPALREVFVAEAQRQNRNTLFGMRLDSRIDATSLRNRAQEFRQGFNNDLSDPKVVQRLVGQLFGTLGLGSGGTGSVYGNSVESQFFNLRNGQVDWASGSALSRPRRLTPEQQALIDQRLIREAGNYDPRLLTKGQNNELASAFEREAARRLEFETNGIDAFKKLASIIDGEKGIKVQGTNLLDVVIQDQSSAGTQIGSPTTVNARYK